MGLEERRVAIHQRQPQYLPGYNGIFSIHALNYSLAETTTHAQNHTSDFPKSPSLTSEEVQLFSDANPNDLDFKDRLTIADRLTTVPQMHVVTRTIEDEQRQTTQHREGTSADTDDHQGPASETTSADEQTTTLSDEQEPTNSDSLVEGSSQEGGEDIFDRLMQTIQGHWLDFVGKMKLSVLDVWKTISSHMMERLESFAAGL